MTATTTATPAKSGANVVAELPVEATITVSARAEYDAETGELSLLRTVGCCNLDAEDEVLGRWDRDVVDSGALVRRLPLGQVVVEVDAADTATKSAVRRLMALGKLVRKGEPWSVYGGQRFRAVRVVTS